MRCIECDGQLPNYSRPDKLFCDDTCRKRFNRRRERVESTLAGIKSQLSERSDVRRYLASSVLGENIQPALEMLQTIRDEIDLLLRVKEE